MNELEIICIYRSAQGREVEFNFLADNSDVVDPEELTAANFMNVMGGIVITTGGYKTIFRSTNFYTLMEPVSFLLETLHWLKGIKSGIWEGSDEFPSCAVIKTMALHPENLVLERKDSDTLGLSFEALSGHYVKRRGAHYFKDEIVKEEAWKNAVNTALKEYFDLLGEIINEDKEHPNAKIMEKYLRIWNAIRN